jgi:hypothetical protein
VSPRSASARRTSWRSRLAPKELPRDRLKNLLQANAFFIVTYNGRTLVTSRAKLVPDLDLSDRDHYQYLIEHDDNGASISEPLESRVIGTPMI